MIGQRKSGRKVGPSKMGIHSARFNVPGLPYLVGRPCSDGAIIARAQTKSAKTRERNLKDVLAPDFTPIKPKGAV